MGDQWVRQLAEYYVGHNCTQKAEAFRLYCPEYQRFVGKSADEKGDKSQAFYHAVENVFERREVIAEIRKIQKETERAERKAREAEAKAVAELWSKRDAVTELLSIVKDCKNSRDRANENGEDVPVTVAKLEKEVIEVLNKMLSYNAPEEQKVDSTVNVEFGEHAEDVAAWSV